MILGEGQLHVMSLGGGRLIPANHLVAIVSPDSAPQRRLVQQARERGTLIDATGGRPARSLVITATDQPHLVPAYPETIAQRYLRRDLNE